MSQSRDMGAPNAPGPRGNWLLGSARAFLPDKLKFLTDLARDYGDVARIRVGPATMYLVSHPDGIRRILVDNPVNYRKGRGIQKAKGLLGQGLLSSEGTFWRKQRRLVAPAFHPDRIGALAPVMARAADEMLAEWDALPDGSTLDVHREIMRLALRIAGLTMFGTDLAGEAERISEALAHLMGYAERTMALPDFVEQLPLGMNRAAKEAVAALDTVVYRLIRSRRADGADRGDLLSMLLSVRDADTGERMDDMQVRDEAMTLLLAGHETTANALTWAFHLLGQDPGATERLREEVTGALGDRLPELEDIARLPYATMVLEEAMRLFPPAWAIGRTAIGDDVIDGYRIRRGAGILIAPWVVHRDPRFWDEPESFRPERFAPEYAAKRPRYAYIPFSAGPRNCIGQAFAMQEGVLVLASVARRYSLAPVPGHTVIPDPVFTLRPQAGLPMMLRRVVHDENSRYATGKV